MALFTYTGDVVSFKSGDPLEPYGGLLNGLAIFAVGVVLFSAWWLADLAVLKLALRGSATGLRGVQQASFAPLFPLVGLMGLLRGALGGSYIRWGLYWIPFVTTGTTLAWHYALLFYLAAPLEADPLKGRLRAGVILLAAGAAAGLMVIAWVLPPLFRGTPEEFLAQFF
ncbi:MAG: hypothetical protein ACTSU5_15070 [Promethearchaeota archaeon]